MVSVTHDRFPFVETDLPGPLKYPIASGAEQFFSGLIEMAYAEGMSNKIRGLRKLIGGAMKN